MAFTTTAADNYLTAVYDGGSITAATHLGLFTADPGAAGALTNEISTSGTNYARAAISAATFPAASSASISNNVQIDYLTPSADWAAGGTTITHAASASSLATATLIHRLTLGTPANVLSTDGAPYFASGDITISVTT